MIIQSQTGVFHIENDTPKHTKCGLVFRMPRTIFSEQTLGGIPDAKFCRKCFQNGKHDATKLMGNLND